jgi:hypothetical protein
MIENLAEASSLTHPHWLGARFKIRFTLARATPRGFELPGSPAGQPRWGGHFLTVPVRRLYRASAGKPA